MNTDIEYRDTGCDLHPACLSCPLPRCRYDEPHGSVSVRRRETMQAAARLRSKGLMVSEVAQQLGISERSVYRATEAA